MLNETHDNRYDLTAFTYWEATVVILGSLAAFMGCKGLPAVI
jgi:hypothetical protein